jgi:hypothetical protein
MDRSESFIIHLNLNHDQFRLGRDTEYSKWLDK